MKWLLSVLILGVLIVGNASSIICQDSRSANTGGPQDKGVPAIKDLRSLIREMFAPVTDKLNLTQEQQFQIIAIIIETEVSAGPLLQSLEMLDEELSELTFSDVLDENRLKNICDNQAAILSELVQLKVRAKSRVYKLLTAEQRAIVDQQFHQKAQLERYLGSIGIYC